jgi:hypothetical protein
MKRRSGAGRRISAQQIFVTCREKNKKKNFEPTTYYRFFLSTDMAHDMPRGMR